MRLNLAKSFGADSGLKERIWAQAAKILLRYYDPKSIFCPASRRNSSLALPVNELVEKFIQEHSNVAMRDT